MAHEEENIRRPLNDERDRLHRKWDERFRTLREEMIEDVDRLIDLQDMEFKEMQKAPIHSINPGDIQEVGPALEDLRGNLVNIWHFNNDTRAWSYYDGEEGSDLTHLVTGEAYLIQVKTTVGGKLNGNIRNLTCVRGDCWNRIVW